MKFDQKYAKSALHHEPDRRSTLMLRDRNPKVKYILENPTQRLLHDFFVEGGLIRDNENKCDRLIVAENLTEEYPDFYFVELKGQDKEQAIKQIDRSIDKLIKELNVDYKSINGRIVLTKTNAPDVNSTAAIKLNKKLRAMNGELKSQNIQFKERLK